MVLWQLIDSAFPAGSFAHSWGLETAFQTGEIDSEASLRRYLRDNLWQTGHAVLPLVTAAHQDPASFAALDAMCDAFLTNAVANRASRQQGRAFVSTCVRVWPSPALTALDTRARGSNGHYAPAAGAVLRILEVAIGDAQQLILFNAARGVLAAAVRLGIVGPYRAQQLQHECATTIDHVRSACASLDVSDVTQTAPIADLLQSTHDRLYSRLFQS
jgi:urease accessory protein